MGVQMEEMAAVLERCRTRVNEQALTAEIEYYLKHSRLNTPVEILQNMVMEYDELERKGEPDDREIEALKQILDPMS